ncbi:ferritin-like domain-containing protein [Sorangium sp. So ce1099]|uniref:ferritin-like domain-containing protein n=1 Tax=Sorangium sp. So ce1099 TaxID=3133331 RepID=UPI003F644C6F
MTKASRGEQIDPSKAGAAGEAGEEDAGAAAASAQEGKGAAGENAGLEQITALILLDMSAAEAYGVALGACKAPELKKQLASFREDHERHVRELSAALGMPAPEQPDERGMAIQRYTELSAREDRTALVAMRGNEELTNDAYASALASELPEELRRLVEANWQDERRHIRWITEEIRTRGWELPELPSTLAEVA